MATSKTRIQNYIKLNKISELFEEMMGKLIKDLPASPVHYLITVLQDKEKKGKQVVRDNKSPKTEKKTTVSSNAMLWATAPAAPAKKSTSPLSPRSPRSPREAQGDSRTYSKPWLANTKSPGATKTKPPNRLSQTTPVKPTSSKKTSKPEWNRKTNLSGTKGDDVVDGNDVDLGLIYANPKIVGESHTRIRDDDEEIETALGSFAESRDEPAKQQKIATPEGAKRSKKMTEKEAKQRRMEELKRLAEAQGAKTAESSQRQLESRDAEDEDDALEVLEDAEELMSEGVKNPPKSGFVVGHSGRKSKEEIELVLNMSKFFDELGGTSGINQAQSVASENKFLANEDEEFESASQVTGPRRPVWEVPESDVESAASQLKSGRRSGINVEMFDVGSDVAKNEKIKSRPRTSEPRPRTAPSRSGSEVEIRSPGGANGRTSRNSRASNASESPSKKSAKSKEVKKKISQAYDGEDEPDARPGTSSSKH